MHNQESANTPGHRRSAQPGGGSSRGTPSGRAPVPSRGNRPGPPRRPQPPSIQNRWFRSILMVLATIVLCVFLAFFALRVTTDLFGLNKSNMEMEVVIPPGTDLGDLTALLNRKSIVLQPFTFRLYAGMKLKDDEINPGRYLMNTNMGYDEILIAIRSGNTVREEVRITFIEGETLHEIAAKLEEKQVCGAQDFLDYLEAPDESYDFLSEIPQDPLRYNRLEGYIFPDTYDFYVGENVSSVARKFLRNFHEKITDSLLERMKELNLTLDETVILASIIQKEAGYKDDMRMVSSVFHNRMGNTETYPRFQSDVTILYVEQDIKPYIRQDNQDIYDAYNTYVREGLPVGAICNPGMNAIETALNPAKSSFYFFVTDAKGEFYYASTPQQHYNNVNRAMQVEGGVAHGIDTH